jgi:biopolymer transport protein ExbD
MKLPRNAKIFRGQLDAAPIAGVLFLLLIFLFLSSRIVFTPGIHISLPEVEVDLPGTADPAVYVAIDRGGQIYFENQVTTFANLESQLRVALEAASHPSVTLVLLADKDLKLETVLQMKALAASSGFSKVILASRPRPVPVRSTPRTLP